MTGWLVVLLWFTVGVFLTYVIGDLDLKKMKQKWRDNEWD